MPMTTYFRTRYGYSPGVFPVTDRVFARSVALPIHAHLSEADQQNVCNTILHVVEELAR
jgi:dTDP-4-amino-4,6-dideoxygalactose transaminase